MSIILHDYTSKDEAMIRLLGINPFISVPDDNILNAEIQKAVNEKPKYKHIRNKRIPKELRYHPKYRQHLFSCKTREMDNYLTEEQYLDIISKPCTYCNGKSTGADRRDSNIPYTIDNSQPCCGKCNMMKYTHREQDFLKHIEQIYKHSNRSN